VGTFYVENFGCRATQADGAAIERQFRECGFYRADSAEAQVVVLNTCTVTASADQDARAAIRRIHRENPTCQIVVTGCYAQRAPEEIAALPGVSTVVGNSHKHELVDIAGKAPSLVVGRWSLAKTSELSSENLATSSAGNFVPLSRLMSLPTTNDQGPTTEVFVSDIFAHTELLAAPEVVISGINLGRWGRDLPVVGRSSLVIGQPHSDQRLESLVHAILDNTTLEKLRISSVEPMDWSDELIHLVATSPRIAKHAHVPMQSGSDRILRAMHRKYRPWHYEDKIRKIRQAMPTAAIGADVMVGFPCETDADFDETRRMIESLPFTYLHIFTYSARPGTPAADLPDQVPVQIARRRNRILRDLAAAKKLEFMRSFVGKSIEAITLNAFDGELTEALTENYLKLRIAGRHLPNQWINARISEVRTGALLSSGLS